ncbi:MAG: type IX secretion system sortase PorU, partial [Ignavibacteria bacterium]
RSFSLFFPGSQFNQIEIIDSKFTEVPNVEVAPVPSLKQSKDKDAVVPVFNKDEKVYSENRYFPGNEVELPPIGSLRNKYFGHLNIYPVLYNPVTNSIKKYTYIRVRVKFGNSPIYNNKILSAEEKSFINDVGINSSAAINWCTKEFSEMKDLPVKNSVLASGDFYKIEIKEPGMYKIDKNFLQTAGINTSGIDPRTIKIYGNGGAELPYKNSTIVPNDLVENRIFFSGQDDGQFNDGDFLIFYGRSANEWKYDPDRKVYKHKVNTFSRSNYYWISYGGSNGQRMNVTNSTNLPGIGQLPSFREMFFEEPDVVNLGSTGILWVSQRISVNQNFTFNKDLPGYMDGSAVNFRFRFGNGSFFPEYWRVEDLNSNFLQTKYVTNLVSGFSHINLIDLGDSPYGLSYVLTPGKSSINFKASLRSQDGNSPNVAGYYDFYEVLYDRYFSAENNVLRFNSPDTSATVEYQISNFTSSDISLYEVSQFENVSMINPVSFSGGVLKFQSELASKNPKEFYAIGGNNYKTPSSISAKISNQNLKGDLAGGASFMIISPKEFLSAANRLKAQREKPGSNYLKTVVVDPEKIYNEFSGGLQDPVALRNFIKYAYNNWEERPVYILFFGDGSYDYKNIYNLYNGSVKNWLPPIEKNSSTSDEIESYCSDDFLVEVTEDYENPIGYAVTDFSSGRLPVNTIEQANIVVDKIISYEDPLNYGKWRNEATYVADDGWTTEATQGEERSVHTDQCEDVAQNHTPNFIRKNKIYIVSYPTEITPQGRRKPGAYADVIRHWNDGRLIINYTGHGSTDLWAHEHVFEKQTSIPQLNNKDKYPFVTIASCDLARWDDPYSVSAAEELVVIKDKGAIAVMAAVRAVYADLNAEFNNELYDNLFKIDSMNLRLRYGKAMFNVKQHHTFDNDLKFSLLGDPTLRLGVPQYITRIDSINGVPGTTLFEMKSLQRVKISGSVLRTDSSFWQDYNGVLDLKVLDVDKTINLTDFGFPFNFRLMGGLIFTGTSSINNGTWNMEFIVPRDISFNPGRGKIIAYFKNNQSDGLGFSDSVIMAGTDSTAAADSTGPVVNLFLGSRSFRNGDIVNQNPKLIADFTDENGINLTGTIGHKIEAILNDNENNKIDLTPFYVSNSGYQTGTVEYQMQNLQDGKYKLEVKAWDTYNNYNTSSIEFNVKGNSDLALDNIYNYPNPMQDFTNFVFEHNFDEPLTADIKIYTVSGRLIKELNKTNITDKFVSLQWDGRDNDGDAIANGTYIYKIFIKSEDGVFSKSTTGKLAKLK